MLTCGAIGAAVTQLQTQLAAAGFSPGNADDVFGAATEAAVLAFQRSEGLLADGIAGPVTLAALQLPADTGAPASTTPITVEVVSRMFPQTHLAPITRNLPLVQNALQNAGLTWPPIMLAALATIRAEAEGFEPISEFVSRYNTSPGGPDFDLYDSRKDLGNRGAPDGAAYKGRGFVQLTGRSNYARFGAKLDIALEQFPDEANDPCNAAALLAAFIQDVEMPMKRALLAGRLATARELVNGGTYGLEKFAEAYGIGLKCLGISLPQNLSA